jgi:methylphosphotriester-DNA--protein-cysteine methyltransferase
MRVEAEILSCLFGKFGDDRNLQASTDGTRDVANRDTLITDCMVLCAWFAIRKRQPEELGSIEPTHGSPRTVFALKFKETVGTSPMEYLTRWRMIIAADKLTNSSISISTFALAYCYDSESALSTAFKLVMGCSPRQYARDQNAMLPSFF